MVSKSSRIAAILVLVVVVGVFSGMYFTAAATPLSSADITVVLLADDQNTRLASQYFQRESFPKVTLSIVSALTLHDLTRIASPFIVIVGHGEPGGFIFEGRLYPWTDLYVRPRTLTILAMCYSSNANVTAITFPGPIDAEIAAMVSIAFLHKALGNQQASDRTVGRMLANPSFANLLLRPRHPLIANPPPDDPSEPGLPPAVQPNVASKADGIPVQPNSPPPGTWYVWLRWHVFLNYQFIVGLAIVVALGLVLLASPNVAFGAIDFAYAIICYVIDQVVSAFFAWLPAVLQWLVDILVLIVQGVIGGFLYFYTGMAGAIACTAKAVIATFVGTFLIMEYVDLVPLIFNLLRWAFDFIYAFFPHPAFGAVAAFFDTVASYMGLKDIRAGFQNPIWHLAQRLQDGIKRIIGVISIPVGPLMAYTLANVASDISSALSYFLSLFGNNLTSAGFHWDVNIIIAFYGLDILHPYVENNSGGIWFDPLNLNANLIFEDGSDGGEPPPSGGGGGGGGGGPIVTPQ